MAALLLIREHRRRGERSIVIQLPPTPRHLEPTTPTFAFMLGSGLMNRSTRKSSCPLVTTECKQSRRSSPKGECRKSTSPRWKLHLAETQKTSALKVARGADPTKNQARAEALGFLLLAPRGTKTGFSPSQTEGSFESAVALNAPREKQTATF